MTELLIKLIQLYRRYISPALGHHCRFAPTCSGYAEEAITRKGLFSGMCLTLYRLSKCHPFHQGGFDPVE